MSTFIDDEIRTRITEKLEAEKNQFLHCVKDLKRNLENNLPESFKLIGCVYNEKDINTKRFGDCNMYTIEIEYSQRHYFRAVDFRFIYIQKDKYVYIEPVVKYTREVLETTVINDNHYSLTDFSTDLAIQFINHSLAIIFKLNEK